MKSFETAARRGQAAVANPIDITFEIDGERLTASPPTTGQLVIFMTAREGGFAGVQGMIDFLAAILDDDGVAIIREKLMEGVELALLNDIITYLIEEWSGRPTKSSSDSPASPRSTGRRSTGKPRKQAASTRSSSR